MFIKNSFHALCLRVYLKKKVIRPLITKFISVRLKLVLYKKSAKFFTFFGRILFWSGINHRWYIQIFQVFYTIVPQIKLSRSKTSSDVQLSHRKDRFGEGIIKRNSAQQRPYQFTKFHSIAATLNRKSTQ